MKLILGILLLLSFACFSQTNNKPLSDSVIKQQKFADSMLQVIVTTTPVQELQQFLYKNASAEYYDTFVKMYQAFINQKFIDLTTKNKKK